MVIETLKIIFHSSLIMIGILFALFSFVLPLRKEILNLRAGEYLSKKNELVSLNSKINQEGDSKEREKLNDKKNDVKQEMSVLRNPPAYFDNGITITAILFVGSGLVSWFALTSGAELTTESGYYGGATILFLGGIILFLTIGWVMVSDIKKNIKKWYESKIDEIDN